MSYFQNVFDNEFRGVLLLGDRQYTLNFNLAGNLNSAAAMLAWTPGPYDMSSNNTLTINYAVDPTLKQFHSLVVNVAGATPSATLAHEIVDILNANSNFTSLFSASVKDMDSIASKQSVLIRSKRANSQIKAYVVNTSAEQVMHFNAKAPIGQLPTYFERHTIANAFTFPDSLSTLIELNPGDSYDASLITAAGQDPLTVMDDWELLKGRSGIFTFTKQEIIDNKIATKLEYPAGAVAGDLAKRTIYTYTDNDTVPSQITEVPYTLTSGDLITP